MRLLQTCVPLVRFGRFLSVTAKLHVLRFHLDALPPNLQKEFDTAANARDLSHLSSLSSSTDGAITVRPSWVHVVQWRCGVCDARWSARLSDRSDPQVSDFYGCPRCRPSKASGPPTPRRGDADVRRDVSSVKESTSASRCGSAARRLLEAYPFIAAQWDATRNAVLHNRVLFESVADVPLPCAAVVWWRCSRCCRSWQESVNHRVTRSAKRAEPLCPKCERHEEGTFGASTQVKWLCDDAFLMLEVVLRPHEDPSSISLRSDRRLQWRCCYCAYEFGANVSDRFLRSASCPQCSGSVQSPLNLLTIQRPDVCREMAHNVHKKKLLHMTIHDDAVVSFVCRTCLSPYRMSVRLRCLLPKGTTACPKCLFYRSELTKEMAASSPVTAGNGTVHRSGVRRSLKKHRAKRQGRDNTMITMHELNRPDPLLMN